jgi:hypothetical protein
MPIFIPTRNFILNQNSPILDRSKNYFEFIVKYDSYFENVWKELGVSIESVLENKDKWIELFDFYRYPGVYQFDNLHELLLLLNSYKINWNENKILMKKFYLEQKFFVINSWNKYLNKTLNF